MKKLFFLILFLSISSSAWAVVPRLVQTTNDKGSGSLREAILGACFAPGDDEIRFHPMTYSEIRIFPKRPIEVPAKCDGTITIIGSPYKHEKEAILDGRELSSGKGILIVKSGRHKIKGLTFVNYKKGAGLVLQGTDNLIEDSYFGLYRYTKRYAKKIDPNQIGVSIPGAWNTLQGNTISANLQDGVFIAGDANALWGNWIGDYKGECPEIKLPTGTSNNFSTFIHEIIHKIFGGGSKGEFGVLKKGPLCGNKGPGVRITGNGNLLGSALAEDSNRILFNEGGGIVIDGGIRNEYRQNNLAYNEEPGIRLLGGGNNDIQPIADFAAFPVKSTPEKRISFRYTLSGVGRARTRAEFFLVASDEKHTAGEGGKYLGELELGEGFFSHTLETKGIPSGSRISAIVCDPKGNCSQFSNNAVLGSDLDQDGILDPVEDPNQNMVVDSEEMDPLLNDTDGDRLSDSVEDKNENGKVDTGETDPKKKDTDDDGLSDWIETGGDGKYDKNKGDTDPLNADTDGDGIQDGKEDKNKNGIVEIGETDPTNSQSK